MRNLVIRFSALGDVVLSFPALRDLALRGGETHFLTLEDFAELVEPLPEIHRVWTLSRAGGAAGLCRLAAQLRKQRFDRILDLHGNLRSRSLRLLIAGSGARWAVTDRQTLSRRTMIAAPDLWRPKLRARETLPVAERHRRAVETLAGPGPRAPEGSYPIPDALRKEVDAELADLGLPPDSRPLALAPGAAWPEKVWPRFDELTACLPVDLPLLLLGGPGEEDLCRALAEAAPGRAIVFAGARPLPRVAAALSRCRALVAGDTGLGHLAEAVGRPTLILYGPTVPTFGFAPRLSQSAWLEEDLACRPCSLHGKRPCRFGDRRCLTGIDPARVVAALEKGGHLT